MAIKEVLSFDHDVAPDARMLQLELQRRILFWTTEEERFALEEHPAYPGLEASESALEDFAGLLRQEHSRVVPCVFVGAGHSIPGAIDLVTGATSTVSGEALPATVEFEVQFEHGLNLGPAVRTRGGVFALGTPHAFRPAASLGELLRSFAGTVPVTRVNEVVRELAKRGCLPPVTARS